MVPGWSQWSWSFTVLEIWVWGLPLGRNAALLPSWHKMRCMFASRLHWAKKTPPLNQFMMFHKWTPLQSTGEEWATFMTWVHSDIPSENCSRIVYVQWNQVTAICSSYFWASHCWSAPGAFRNWISGYDIFCQRRQTWGKKQDEQEAEG